MTVRLLSFPSGMGYYDWLVSEFAMLVTFKYNVSHINLL